MGAIKLDLKDKKILEALDLNARYFISDIAKKVKLNKEVVKYRIHNLEKKGIIKGYHTLINYAKLGLTTIDININLMDTKKEDVEAILKFIQSSPNLQTLRQSDVNWDIIFTLVVSNLKEFERFHNELNESFRKFVEFEKISITTGTSIFSRGYIPKSEKQRINVDACADKEEFDATDIEILKIIAYDAKCPLIDIAKKLKLDSMTIKRRIESMVKRGIIAGFRTRIDPKTIGINNYSIKLQLFDTRRINSFREHIASLPATVNIRRSIGGYDFEFDVEVADYFELEKLMSDIRDNFPIIREVMRFTTLNTIRPNIHEKLDVIIELPEKKSEQTE